MVPKEVISKAMQDLGLVEKCISDAEKIIIDIHQSVLTEGNMVDSIDLAYLLRGQLTMAKFIRRKLSAKIADDYQKSTK